MNSAVLNQPTRAAQVTGLRGFLAACGFVCVLVSIGCNADPRCRRETALLRAEILDIEDKYAVLQSQYESTALALHQFNGQPIDQTVYGATSNYHDVVLNQEIISDGAIIPDGTIISDGAYGDTYPTDGVIYGTPVPSYPQGTGIVVENPITQLNDPYNNGQSVLIEPADSFGLPATEGIIINQSIDQGILESGSTPTTPRSLPTEPRSLPNDDSLPLPNDARHRSDDFESRLHDRTRRTIPALQASVTRGRSYSNNRTRSSATEITINRSQTSGQDVNGSPGDEGLNLLLQTKDINGQIVLQAGELIVSLIDPKQRQRIGFWRFLAGETELFFVDKNDGTGGILLHLPWDESVPRHSRLLVHIQFVTEDGRTLTTSSDVLIDPPTADYSPADPTVIDWTQRDERWGDAEDSYVTTDLDSLEDSFRVEDRRRADSDWQRNGTFNRGAKFSKSNDRDYSRSNSRSKDSARVTDVRDNPDQPKWRPVR